MGPRSADWCRAEWLDAAFASPKNTDRDLHEAIAIGIGLHLRPGELHELRVRDLDLDAGEVRVERSHDEKAKKTKAGTKTDEGVRTVSVPSWLAPLLKRISDERAPNERVAPWVARTHEDARADAFRAWLRNGGAPERLFAETETHEAVDFRSIRDTGITLRFLGGERAEVVQREAGHRQITTTLGYAKEVANKGGRYGNAFVTLPPELVGAPVGGAGVALCAASAGDVNDVNGIPVSPGKLVARVGFEPTTFGL